MNFADLLVYHSMLFAANNRKCNFDERNQTDVMCLAKAFIQKAKPFYADGEANELGGRLAHQRCAWSTSERHCAAAAAWPTAQNVGRRRARSPAGPSSRIDPALPRQWRASVDCVLPRARQVGWTTITHQGRPRHGRLHPLHLPERIPIAIRDAFLQARRERRPVVLGIPFDLQIGQDGPEIATPRLIYSAPLADPRIRRVARQRNWCRPNA